MPAGNYKSIRSDDKKSTKSFLSQLIDVVQEDISGSATRKKYQVFVTGGIGSGVTSSLFQTVYDQDFSLQTSNEIFDITVGLFTGSAEVTGSTTGYDENDKPLFSSGTLMMREKINIYKQYAATFLGNATSQFCAPYNTTDGNDSDKINSALFINFKRLFTRDGIKRETFAMKLYPTASEGLTQNNLERTSEEGLGEIITDIGANLNRHVAYGGNVGDLAFASNTSNKVGLIFYDQGTIVLDVKKIISGTQKVSGTIDAMQAASTIQGASILSGKTIIGSPAGNPNAKFIPDFMVSASIDNIVDHFASTRFQSGSLTAATFQNKTQINSSLYFCNVQPDEFNGSSNPTYVDEDGKLNVVDDEITDKPFAFVTSIGLYDADENLMAVAKTSRPIEINDEKNITFRVRLDF